MKIGDKVQLASGEAEVTRKVYDQSLKKTVFYAGDIRLTGSEKPVEAENIIVKKLEAVEAAIKSIPKVEIPEYPQFPAFPEPKDFPEFPAFPKEMTVNVPDLSSIEKKLDTIIRKEDNETKELIRNAIDELKKTKTDSGVISAIQKLSEIIPESQDYTNILKEISEKLTPIVQEDLKINKEQWKQLTTALSSIGGFGGGPSAVQLRDEAGDILNPATEDGQTAIATAIGNITFPLPTGAASSAKQDSQIVLETTLNSLIETLQELVQRLAPLAGAVANTAQIRVVQTSVPSTAVTGPITSAQSIAEKATGGISFPEKIAITNLTAIQSNINNVTA